MVKPKHLHLMLYVHCLSRYAISVNSQLSISFINSWTVQIPAIFPLIPYKTMVHKEVNLHEVPENLPSDTYHIRVVYKYSKLFPNVSQINPVHAIIPNYIEWYIILLFLQHLPSTGWYLNFSFSSWYIVRFSHLCHDSYTIANLKLSNTETLTTTCYIHETGFLIKTNKYMFFFLNLPE
jgi:hypothetical protein